MNRTRLAIVVIITLLGVPNLPGQEKTVIRGRVIDEADQSAVIGATIVEYDRDERGWDLCTGNEGSFQSGQG